MIRTGAKCRDDVVSNGIDRSRIGLMKQNSKFLRNHHVMKLLILKMT